MVFFKTRGIIKFMRIFLLCFLLLSSFSAHSIELAPEESSPVIFDLPVTYNDKVQEWIHFFQTKGKRWFKTWLGRSYRYIPDMQAALQREGLPTDLVYLAMIESGFSAKATSHAQAVGPWQFIEPTAGRFGLKIKWWLDERRDFDKSTIAAIKYFKYLHKEFKDWYLVMAAYNTGEGRVRRLIKKHKTKDFWELAEKKGLFNETKNYIPKMIAAMLIAKTPKLYGFRKYNKQQPIDTELFFMPGGTQLNLVADHLKITQKSIRDLNPELIRGYIPDSVTGHRVRIPKGAGRALRVFLAQKD